VITGCGHAGIVNICRFARRLTKERALYAVIGGFHLNGPIFEPLIPLVLDDLGAFAPRLVVPAHCTGWRAQHAMAARFGEAFIPNTIGTRFRTLTTSAGAAMERIEQSSMTRSRHRVAISDHGRGIEYWALGGRSS
jgi:hypothetical protein